MRLKHSLALLAGALLSVNAQAMDLMHAYQLALVNDPVFSGARHQFDADQEQVTQARAGLLPSVGISGSYSQIKRDSIPVGSPIPSTARGSGYTVSLTQPLFRWANWQQYQQSKLAVAASEAQLAQAQQELILRVAQAYFEVLAAQDALASVQAQKTAITEQLASAKRNFEVGTATITDTHEAQARFDLALAQEFAAQSELAVKRAALQQITGKPVDHLAGLRSGTELNSPLPAGIEQWVESARLQNYGVITQEFRREIAQRDISKARAAHLPTVDLVASRNHNNQRGTSTNFGGSNLSDSTSVGVQWNIPLFSGFAVSSQVQQAVALAERARSELENAQRIAAQNARQAFFGVTSGLAQIKALEAAEVSSRSALESNQLGYEVGVRINIDVLNAQQQLFVTRRDLARARYDTILNSLKLESSAGVLNEEDVVQVNTLLAHAVPEPHNLPPKSNGIKESEINSRAKLGTSNAARQQNINKEHDRQLKSAPGKNP